MIAGIRARRHFLSSGSTVVLPRREPEIPATVTSVERAQSHESHNAIERLIANRLAQTETCTISCHPLLML
jgi:hypothetical protein